MEIIEDIEDDSQDMAGAVGLDHQCDECKELCNEVFHKNTELIRENGVPKLDEFGHRMYLKWRCLTCHRPPDSVPNDGIDGPGESLQNISDVNTNSAGIVDENMFEMDDDFEEALDVTGHDGADIEDHFSDAITVKNGALAGLLTLICTLACQRINKTMNETEKLLVCLRNSEEIMDNYPKKDEAKELMSHVNPTHPTEWSTEVQEAWQVFKSKHSKKGTPEERTFEQAKAIWNRWEECESMIKNHVNPLWPDPFKSGTNESSVLKAILLRCWKHEANRLSRSALSSEKTRRRAKYTGSNDKKRLKTLTETQIDEQWLRDHDPKQGPGRTREESDAAAERNREWVNTKINEKLQKYDLKWQPVYWISFMAFSYPERVRKLDSFIVNAINADGLMNSSRALGKRVRNREEIGGDEENRPSKKSGGETNTVVVQHQINRQPTVAEEERSRMTVLRGKLDACKELLEWHNARNADPDIIDTLEVKIKELLESMIG